MIKKTMTTTARFNKGSMLIDLMIALLVGSLFVAIVANNASGAREIFENAKARFAFLDVYDMYADQFVNLLPSQVLAIGTTTTISSTLFGNNFYQNKMEFGSSSLANFILIKSKQANNIPVNSQPICSPEFAANQILVDNVFNFRNIHLPIDPSIFPTNIIVRNNIAYITLDSNSAGDPDFAIFDLGTSTEAKILSQLNTGPGLVDLVLAGKYIYGVAPSTVGQVHIIRLDSLSVPTLLTRYKLPLPFATATPPLGSSIDYAQNRLYLGTEKWIGEELNVIDISDRVAPHKVSGLEIDSKVTDILSHDDVVYFTAANINQFSILQSDTNGQGLHTVFSPSGWERQEGKTISLFEDNLALGRTSGGFDLVGDHELFMFGTTSAPTFTDYTSANFPGGIYGILRDHSFLYVISRAVNKEFQIFNPLSTSTLDISLPFLPHTLTCDQDKIFILAHQSPFVYEITLSAQAD